LAQAAAPTQETYMSAFYGRLAARRGKQRAIMAVAHSLMVSVLPMLTRQEPYREMGARYCDERRHMTRSIGSPSGLSNAAIGCTAKR
jgi:hypothetical protein